jgi:hypothetical protein
MIRALTVGHSASYVAKPLIESAIVAAEQPCTKPLFPLFRNSFKNFLQPNLVICRVDLMRMASTEVVVSILDGSLFASVDDVCLVALVHVVPEKHPACNGG